MRTLRTILILGVLILIGTNDGYAQSKKGKKKEATAVEDPFFAVGFSDADEVKMVQHVKLMDQFIHRFNLTQNIKGERIDVSDSTLREQRQNPEFEKRYQDLRRQMLLRLTDSQKEWGADTVLITKMADYVIGNDVYINLTDQKWHAVVTGLVEVDGVRDTIALVMQNVPLPGNAATWKIVAANAAFLSAEREKELTYIQPLAHESNFIDLTRTFSSGRTFNQVIDADVIANDLLNLQLMVAENRIKYLSTVQLVYRFSHFANHVFEVINVKRDDGNTGWLITKIQPR